VQVRYTTLNADASLRTRLMNVALMAFNALRPRGRERIGLSAGILGNGFALAAETLRPGPYTADSVVEDLEYHLLLVRMACACASPMRLGQGGHADRRQRQRDPARALGGRPVADAAQHAPVLLRRVLGANGACWSRP
jgi:hypothetical protein